MGKGNSAARTTLALLLSFSPGISFAAELTPFPLALRPSPPTPTAEALNAGRKCLSAYSPSLGMNATVLSVNVAVDGSVKNVTVTQSSGVAAFDEAARSCVAANWRYHPAWKDGKSVEAVVKLAIKWEFVPKHAGKEEKCGLTEFQQTYFKAMSTQVYVELSFTIATDGSVKNVQVIKSSGDSRFDYDATNCVGAWHYQPIIKDGQPIEYPVSLRIQIRPH
jgi:TonB family protein